MFQHWPKLREGLRSAYARVRRRRPWPRRVRPDDTFLVSYPRSGNTWLRFLVTNLLRPQEPATYASLRRLVPDIYAQPEARLEAIPSPRILKSHEKRDRRYRRVILLVRDPRDVIVSYYHFRRRMRAITSDVSFETHARGFLDGSIDGYGPWGDHTRLWLKRRNETGVLLLRYEDLLTEPERELQRVGEHLGLHPGASVVRAAIARSRAEEMRRLERLEIDPLLPHPEEGVLNPLVREARSGGWREALPSPTARAITTAWGDLMGELGYSDS